MKTITALTLRKRFGKILDDVARRREPVVITRANKPLVVLVPAEDYAAAGGSPLRETRLRLAAERLAEWRRRHADRLADMDPVALVRQSRISR